MTFSDRIGALSDAAARAVVDAVVITPSADLRYLTGYDAKALERLTCLAVAVGAEPVLIVPALERPAASASPAGSLGFEIVGWSEPGDPFALLAARLGSSVHRIAVGNRAVAEHVLPIADALTGVALSLAGDLLRELRAVKDPEEIASLRRAGAAIDEVHRQVPEFLRVGRTEAEVARDIADAILAAGHATVDFTIVGSGPGGASPHHEVSKRRIEAGDPLVVDIGGTMPDGYCSDSTRTYVVGADPDPDFLALYEVLQAAQDAGCAAVKPGVRAESVDAAARTVIAAAGYGDNFFHRTGHGIGMESHEHPYIVAGNTEELKPGHAFSVEPGIYLPGRFGARIEDIVICTEQGVERLNTTNRSLTVVPG